MDIGALKRNGEKKFKQIVDWLKFGKTKRQTYIFPKMKSEIFNILHTVHDYLFMYFLRVRKN
jgi:hypothetical protein